jgi:hypothetical protein
MDFHLFYWHLLPPLVHDRSWEISIPLYAHMYNSMYMYIHTRNAMLYFLLIYGLNKNECKVRPQAFFLYRVKLY